MFRFAKLMLEVKPIRGHDDGISKRECTCVDDVVLGIEAALNYGLCKHKGINVGNGRAVCLCEPMEDMEKALHVRGNEEKSFRMLMMCVRPGQVSARRNACSNGNSGPNSIRDCGRCVVAVGI